ncbi:hypothetical protein RhiXN_06239 [Rhizoctonia solani]|uniref:4a-hydroxytetrahydrobiopterin dehydratase n=1 Tax=Rhizoctonia solani TaxID=456999 RepID=A0A8H8NXB4_9AGAM|nr:uncharacterized protein RhiXN_06239 [Rhizoctonia solani]QRW21250.1 hypothetical protein RhiXN_06239 [Rhizoctonia solani]
MNSSILEQDLETHINALRGNGWHFRQSNRNIEQNDMWELRHSGRFPSFKAAMGYVNDVANLAKSEKHHPTIVIFDRVNVAIALITHDTAKPPIIDAPSTDLHAPATRHPGITLRDIRMALLINPLLDLYKVIDRSPPTEDPIPRYEDLMGVNIEKSN